MAAKRAKAKSAGAQAIEVGVDPIGGVQVKVPVEALDRVGKAGSWFSRQVETIAGWVAPDYAARVKLTTALADSTSAALAAGAHLSDEQRFLLGRALRREERAAKAEAATMAVVVEVLPEVERCVNQLPPSNVSTSEAFVRHAEAVAAVVDRAEVARLFARALAGEACRPGTISVATLETVKLLDPRAADAFQRLLLFAIVENDGDLSLPHGCRPEHGLTNQELFALFDANLLDATEARIEFNPGDPGGASFRLGGYHLRARAEGRAHPVIFTVHRVKRAGSELATVLPPVSPDAATLHAFAARWPRQLLEVEASGGWLPVEEQLATTPPAATPARSRRG